MPALFHGYGAVDISSCTALAVAQGLTVVLPRRPRRVALRIPHTWAAILPPAAFLATVAGLATHPSLALAVVGIACVGVPALGALAMAAFARGGRPARALVVVPLLALAALQAGLAGEVAVLMLVMLSCVALGSLLAACAGVRELVIAALLVAVLDLVLMQAGGIRIATAALLDAHIEHLPDFAQPVLGRMTIGYGDFFVAALAGAIAARQPSHQMLVALARRPSPWRSTRSRPRATCCPPRRPSPWPWWWRRWPPAGERAAGCCAMLISDANHLPGRPRRPAAPGHRAHRAAPAPAGR
jgi:hypothetical protein